MLDLTKKQKGIIIGILIIAFYFIYSKYLSYLPLAIANISLNTFPLWVRALYFIITDIFFMAILALTYHKTLVKDFKDYKKNMSNYIDLGIRYWVLGIIGMSLSSFIITFGLGGGISQNEEAVRSMIDIVPYYMLFSTAVYAPFVEELTFRKAIKDIFGKSILFVLISGIFFGAIHVIFNATTLIEYLQIIPYSSVGLALAYMYYKTDNILVPMSIHFIHNFTFTLLLMVLGL